MTEVVEYSKEGMHDHHDNEREFESILNRRVYHEQERDHYPGNVTCGVNGTLESGERTKCEVTGLYANVGTVSIYGKDSAIALVTC